MDGDSHPMQLSAYRAMWVITMFDLPVDTKPARKRYQQFRRGLLTDGFTQMQYSIYKRHCPSQENANVHIRRVEKMIPPDGAVRILTITDKQFSRMKAFHGKQRSTIEEAPEQLQFF